MKLACIYKLVTQTPVLVTLIWYVNLAEGGNSDEARLLRDLLRSYNSVGRPVHDPGEPVLVKAGVSLIYLLDLDPKGQTLDTLVWLDLEWNDPSLRWSPEYSNQQSLSIPGDLIWSPDITVSNLVRPLERTSPNRKVISSDGTVFWSRSLRVVSYCACDPTSLEHSCKLTLMSWSYNGFQLDLRSRSENVDLSNYVYNRQWTLTDTNVTRNVVTYACCTYPDINAVFKFEETFSFGN